MNGKFLPVPVDTSRTWNPLFTWSCFAHRYLSKGSNLVEKKWGEITHNNVVATSHSIVFEHPLSVSLVKKFR